MTKATTNIYNLIIVDESGSMQPLKNQTIKGFNDLITQIKHNQNEFINQKHFLSFVTFNDSGVKFKLFNQAIAEASPLNYGSFNPDGLTPLFDAICKSVLRLKHELYMQKNYQVLVTIITDGEENNSTEFTVKESKLLIENLSQQSNWAFGLIGANINVEVVAKNLSIPIKRTLNFTADEEGVNSMFNRYNQAQSNLAFIINNDGDCDDLPFKGD